MSDRMPRIGKRTELDDALDEASKNNWSTPCKGRPAEFTDYLVAPTAEEADALCGLCPVRSVCKPGPGNASGVYGGKVYRDGKRVTRSGVEISQLSDQLAA